MIRATITAPRTTIDEPDQIAEGDGGSVTRADSWRADQSITAPIAPVPPTRKTSVAIVSAEAGQSGSGRAG